MTDNDRGTPRTNPDGVTGNSPDDRRTIEGVTDLLTRYVTAYVHSDRDLFSSCFHPEVSSSMGDEFLSSKQLRAKRGDEAHYFDARRGHWSPPLRTCISVRPINRVSALGTIRWHYPPTSTGIEYQNLGMYLCVRTDDGWKVFMVLNPTDSGLDLVSGNCTHHQWDVSRWEIHRTP